MLSMSGKYIHVQYYQLTKTHEYLHDLTPKFVTAGLFNSQNSEMVAKRDVCKPIPSTGYPYTTML
jgi:hypothetical protein